MTRPLATALALLAAPAYAETCHFGPNGTNATIAPHDEHFAQVHIQNRLASRQQTTCALTLWGVTVKVLYEAAPFDAPDTFHIDTPPGFIAIPSSVVVDDRDSARVMIALTDGVGM